MSQRECAGFNWPPLSIPAEEPISICPEAVNRAGPQIAAKSCRRCCTFDPSALVMLKADSGLPARLLLHDGVGHPDSQTVFRLLSLLPAALFPFLSCDLATYCSPVPPGSLAVGVPQPARCTATSASPI